MSKIKTFMSGEPMRTEYIGRNEWIYNIECCDCGLRHFFILTKEKKNLFIKGFRDDYATRLARKKKK